MQSRPQGDLQPSQLPITGLIVEEVPTQSQVLPALKGQAPFAAVVSREGLVRNRYGRPLRAVVSCYAVVRGVGGGQRRVEYLRGVVKLRKVDILRGGQAGQAEQSSDKG